MEEIRHLRHQLRGAFHNLRLCTEVFATADEPGEMLEWLEQIEVAADECARYSDALQQVLPGEGPAEAAN